VSATTPGATLSIEGMPTVNLPSKIDLPAGLHRLRVSADGAREWPSAVLLKAGELQRIGPIELGAPDARLRVTSTPSGAQITVAGVFRGRTPATVELPAGSEHDVAVSLQGYRNADRRVFAAAGQDLALAVALQPIPVSVTVQGEPAGAEVLIGVTVKGKTPLTFELPARPHTLELRKDGMQPERIEVDLSSALARTVDYKLLPVGRAQPLEHGEVHRCQLDGSLDDAHEVGVHALQALTGALAELVSHQVCTNSQSMTLPVVVASTVAVKMSRTSIVNVTDLVVVVLLATTVHAFVGSAGLIRTHVFTTPVENEPAVGVMRIW